MPLMRLKLLFPATLLAFVFQGCWVGDQDDPEILYETTIIEVLCQTPEFSTFCNMIYLTPPVHTGNSAGLVPIVAWQLQFAGRDIVNGMACPSNVESIFAPTNQAWENFLNRFPHWESIYDIPQDTLTWLVQHHIYTKGKLMNNLGEDPECTAVEVVGGATVRMWTGNWQFLENAQGEFIARSVESNEFTTVPIQSPDISSTDGVVYRLADVLPPF